jgi:bacillithiol synthase
MECHCISPANLPNVTPLYRAFLTDFPKVSEYYIHPPTFDAIVDASGKMQFDSAIRRGVVEVLRQQNSQLGGDAVTVKNLDHLANGAVAVVTGQQVGLLGGPAYCVYKALTAIDVAAELTARGIDAVPVFWLATEDHDLEEVAHAFFAGRGGLEEFSLAVSGSERHRVGEIPLGEGIAEIATRAGQLLEGPSASEVTTWIADSYGAKETFGSAFGKLMTRIFAGRGLIFIDPLSPELHRLSAGTMRRAIEEHASISESLIFRSAALENAGYHAQVNVAPHSTLVFRIVDGQRLSLRLNNGGFSAGEARESLADTLEHLESHPQDFSANALLRPVIQDTLLPTVAYVGGPAEVAYYAQASVIQKRLLGRAPVILPRASFTLVPPHVAGLLQKYHLDVTSVLAGGQNLRAQLEAEVLPEALSARFVSGEREIQSIIESIREPLSKLDPTLIGALDNAAEKMLYQFNGLRAKAGRAEGLRVGVLDGHERKILSFLLPKGALQERSLSLLPFLATEGAALLDHLDQCIRIGTGEHCVLNI